MSNQALIKRSDNQCELCHNDKDLSIYVVPPQTEVNPDNAVVVCQFCLSQINQQEPMDNNHWRCLTESMWSEHTPVQVLAWRLLTQLNTQSWAQDALELLYLDDETLKWAQQTTTSSEQNSHKDCNGAPLLAGDTVVLIKDLNVKGSSFVAKRGTAVRKISVVHDNDQHIEGRINGQRIVILTKFVKKSS